MIGTTLKQRARRVRLAAVENTTASVDETPSAYFPARLVERIDTPQVLDGSPRLSGLAQRFVYHFASPALGPGYRVELHGVEGTYELLGAPKVLRQGQNVAGYEAQVVEIGTLYPAEATFEGLSSAVPMPLALFSGSEELRGHGDYDNYEAEAPIEYAEQVQPGSTVLLIDGDRWRVVFASVDYQHAFLKLALRRS